MKILILGGTGVLSSDFTKIALDCGNQVYTVNRGKHKEYLDPRAKLIIADLRAEDTETLKSKICTTDYDVVVDFLSFNPLQLEKTLRVVKQHCIQYVFISSATAYEVDDNRSVINEDVAVGNENWEYAQSKKLCEDYIKEKVENYTVIRPYITFGKSRIPFQFIPDKEYYSLLWRIKNEEPVILYNSGENLCNLTCTVDFARVLYKLLMNENARNQCFHITSDEVFAWKDIYFELCRYYGTKPNLIGIDEKRFRKYFPDYCQVVLGDKGHNRVFDNSKVKWAVGGYEFVQQVIPELRKSVEYLESNESKHIIDYKWMGEVDYALRKISGYRPNPKLSFSSKKDRALYTLMTHASLRVIYDVLRAIKHKIKK